MKMTKLLLMAVLWCGTTHAQAAEPAKRSELESRRAIKNESSNLFLAKDYAGLDARMAYYAENRTRTSSGAWASGLFADGILDGTGWPEYENDASIVWWDALEERVRGWADERPDSPLARLTLTKIMMDRAWRIRGGGYAPSVSESARAQFRQHMQRAHRYLESESKVASRYPEYYEKMIWIEIALGSDRQTVDAIYDEATRRFPNYYPVYLAMTSYLLPKWHGDAVKIEAFARDAISRSRKSEARSIYARIYWYASKSQYEEELFNNSIAEWKQMKGSFDVLIEHYPDQWNIRHYAYFACLAQDGKSLKNLLPRISGTGIPSDQQELLSLDMCHRLIEVPPEA
jgi:hypothetical protein